MVTEALSGSAPSTNGRHIYLKFGINHILVTMIDDNFGNYTTVFRLFIILHSHIDTPIDRQRDVSALGLVVPHPSIRHPPQIHEGGCTDYPVHVVGIGCQRIYNGCTDEKRSWMGCQRDRFVFAIREGVI